MVHAIGSYAIYFVSGVFLLGMAGSTVVVLFSFFDDFFELFSKEETQELARTQPPTT